MENYNNNVDTMLDNVNGGGNPPVIQTDPNNQTPPVVQPQPNVQNTGPDQAFAAMRRELEALKAENARYQDPEIKKLIEDRETAKRQAEAQRLGATPELLARIQEQEARYQEILINDAVNRFTSFATSEGMPQHVQQDFANYLDNLFPNGQHLANKFNFKPYLSAYAAERGIVVKPQVDNSAAVFVPGMGSNTTLQSDAEMQKIIRERAKALM